MLRRLQQGCFLPWPRHFGEMQVMIPATHSLGRNDTKAFAMNFDIA